MRHSLHTEIEIHAPAETVWAVLTDLENYVTWNPFITEASGEIAVGSTLMNRIAPPDGRAMTFKPMVTLVEPARVFEWLGRLGFRGVFDGRHRFELTPTPSGGTRLLHSEDFQGLLVRPMRKSLDTQTRAGFEAMNVALKRRAEAIASGQT